MEPRLNPILTLLKVLGQVGHWQRVKMFHINKRLKSN